MIGTSRETVTRVLKGLKQEGWLEQEGKHYLVPAATRPRREARSEPQASEAERRLRRRRTRSLQAPAVPALEPPPGYADVTRHAGGAGRFAAWLLGSLSSGVVAIDRDGRLVALNAGAQRILGCPRADLDAALGRDCREVFAASPPSRGCCSTRSRRAAALARRARAGRRRRAAAGTIGFTLAPVRDAAARSAARLLFRDLDADRAQRRAGAAARAARRARRDGRGPRPRAPQSARGHGGAGRPAPAPPARSARGARARRRPPRRAAHSSRRPSPRASTSCGRWRSARSPVDVGELVEEALASRRRARRSRASRAPLRARCPGSCADEQLLRGVAGQPDRNAFEAMSGRRERPRAHRELCDAKPRARASASRALRPLGARGRRRPRGRAAAGAVREVAIAVSDTGPGHPRGAARADLLSRSSPPRSAARGSASRIAQKVVLGHGGSLELESAPRRGRDLPRPPARSRRGGA